MSIDDLMLKLVGTHVKWEKVKGKENPSMQETVGFGVLLKFSLGKSLRIYGDGGIITSLVKIVCVDDQDRLRVVTNNSTYLITSLLE